MTGVHEFVIAGELPAAFADQFSPLAVHAANGQTVLVARDLDQAAVHGVLARIAGLGLVLIRMDSHHRSDESASGSPGPG